MVGWIAAVLIGANDLGANHFGICFDKDVVNLLSICPALETAASPRILFIRMNGTERVNETDWALD